MKTISIWVFLSALTQILPVSVVADDLFPSCTLQTREDDNSDGRFVFKNEGAHFRNNAVVLAPRCYYVKSRRNSPIVVELFTGDGSRKFERATLKSTGFCPGNDECLGASTYLTKRNGKYYKRTHGSIIVKIRPTGSGTRCDCSYYLIADPARRIAFRAPIVEAALGN